MLIVTKAIILLVNGEGKNTVKEQPARLILDKNSDDPYIPLIARIYKPGEEVPNTSYESQSWLLKGKLHFNKYASLSANFRDTRINYGDIMPSRLAITILRIIPSHNGH